MDSKAGIHNESRRVGSISGNSDIDEGLSAAKGCKVIDQAAIASKEASSISTELGVEGADDPEPKDTLLLVVVEEAAGLKVDSELKLSMEAASKGTTGAIMRVPYSSPLWHRRMWAKNLLRSRPLNRRKLRSEHAPNKLLFVRLTLCTSKALPCRRPFCTGTSAACAEPACAS